ncbi:MAG: aryl-sulfate sulfotransferase [Deltaproteobacteria bacterium]|nr:aryl-sulfate sulfotransferase [Deltaproteobacteria bacterium]
MILLALLACQPGPSPLMNLRVEENPNSVIAPLVRWTTSEPGSSWVVYSDGARSWRVGSDALVTEHQVALVGMVADTAWSVVASSDYADGAHVSAHPLPWQTPPLPFDAPTLTVGRAVPERTEPGWTLMNLGLNHFLVSPSIAIMVDPAGRIVWYRDLGPETGAAVVEAQWCGDRVSIGGYVAPGVAPVEVDLSGEVLWEGWVQPQGLLDTDTMHHTLQCPQGGERLSLFYDTPNAVAVDVVMALDDQAGRAWVWNAGEHIPEAAEEHIHLNMVVGSPDAVWVNSLLLRQLFKVDRQTGEVLWRLGEGGDFELTEGSWFQGAHGTEWVDPTHVLMYENAGVIDENDPSRPYSRAVEYQVDEAAMTARQVWAWPDEPEEGSVDFWHNWIWGDADRLANGNTLINAGSMAPQDSPSRILEVSPAGEVVWELFFPEGEPPSGSYAAQRVPAFAEEL